MTQTIKAAFFTTKIEAIYRNQKSHKRSYVYKIIQHPNASDECVMYFHKDFFLTDEINNQLFLYVESGFIDRWVLETIQMKFFTTHAGLSGPKVISMENLSGIFGVFIAGNLISISIFIVENLIFQLKRKCGQNSTFVFTM